MTEHDDVVNQVKKLARLKQAKGLNEELITTKNYWFREKFCGICGRPILMLTFHGTGVCCQLCWKIRAGELTYAEAEKQRPK